MCWRHPRAYNHRRMAGRRLLVCGPAFRRQVVDGLQDVVRDLIAGLRARDWQIDSLLWPEDFGDGQRPSLEIPDDWSATMGRASRVMRIPDRLRLAARTTLRDRALAPHASRLLTTVDRRIADGRYDAVLALLDTAPIGLASLVTRAHPRAILISLPALGRELRGRRALEAVRHRWLRLHDRRWHPDLFRPVHPARIRHVVFASDSWRDEAIAAGLPPAAARTSEFGVDCPRRLEPCTPSRSPARLLWAARLSPEKGLHVFLPAVARLRPALPVQLTVVAGPGPASYRTRIERLVRTLELEDAVRFQGPVDRSGLRAVLTSHDAFLFASVFHAPVAQMLLHAFAHGLVVVGPASRDPRSVLQADRTAFCFSDSSPAQVATAIRRAVVEVDLRGAVRARAFELTRDTSSLDATIASYDALLTSLTSEASNQARP
jgi:glycosyltransferase involved in cell wall biosynthesis